MWQRSAVSALRIAVRCAAQSAEPIEMSFTERKRTRIQTAQVSKLVSKKIYVRAAILTAEAVTEGL